MTDEQEEKDVAWLEARAREESHPAVDAERVAQYLRLEALIRDLAPDPQSADSRRCILELVSNEENTIALTKTKTRALPIALFASLLGAAAAAVVRFTSAPQAAEMHINVVVRSGENIVRSNSTARLGDVLEIEGGPGELRIYRGTDQIVLRCPTDRRCFPVSDGYSARFELDAPGEYRVVAFRGPSAPETGTLDGDVAAEAAGQDVMFSSPIRVH